jgi:putative transcriptional regulator
MTKTGRRVTVKEVEEELAKYCYLSREGIRHVKRGTTQPSLPLAFKIAKYFKCEIQDIFIFTDEVITIKGNTLLDKASGRNRKSTIRPIN